ncbi:hypothetical protein NDU88_002845 [Pleurodeles waltl]|uniref:Uncharacterized protein n=1 Tax=Pleurodeles waltl TaxID=8319 RepID=A0AAV7TLW5_PLEWA|nr:hypothetical protein NDU88_002845 [Pleurodeles waltl]
MRVLIVRPDEAQAELDQKAVGCGVGLWAEAAWNLEWGRRFSAQVKFRGTEGTEGGIRGITPISGTVALRPKISEALRSGNLGGFRHMMPARTRTQACAEGAPLVPSFRGNKLHKGMGIPPNISVKSARGSTPTEHQVVGATVGELWGGSVKRRVAGGYVQNSDSSENQHAQPFPSLINLAVPPQTG